MIPDKAIKKVKNDTHREIIVGTLLAYGVFPQTKEGIDKAKKIANSVEQWLAPSELPEYYDDIDSDLLTGKSNNNIKAIRKSLITFYNIEDKNKESIKKELVTEETIEERVEVSTPTIPQAHYIQGTKGRWQPEFESDIDHAIYFAGKSPSPKGPKQKEVLDWLYSLGLSFDDIKTHREKIKETILETVNLPGVEEEYPYVWIDEIEQSFSIDQEEDYDEEEYEIDEDDEGLDDLLNSIQSEDVQDEEEPEGLDNLLGQIINEDDGQEEVQQAAQDIESDVEEYVDDGVDVSDLPKSILEDEDFMAVLNRTKQKSRSTTGNVTNRTLLNTIKSSFGSIQATLDSVNRNIEVQNALIVKNIDSNVSVSEIVSSQTSTLESKFDQLFNVLNGQIEQAKSADEARKKATSEANLERRDRNSGTSGFTDTSGRGGGGSIGRLLKFLGKKLGARLWKLLPRRLRARFRLAGRTLGKVTPQALRQRAAAKLIQQFFPKAAQKTATEAAPRLVAKGFEHIALPGISRTATNVADKVTDVASSNGARKALGEMLKPAAISQITEPKSGMKVAMSAMQNAKVQAAIVKRGGQELLTKVLGKLGFKVAGQFTGVGTALNVAYGLGEAIARTAMGDAKGGLLSLGGAIPFLGAGFSIVDVIRDIDPVAYSKHVEPNLGSIAQGDGKPVAKFFAEVSGEDENSFERGGLAKKGIATLHGTEWVGTSEEYQNLMMSSMSPTIGAILAAVGSYSSGNAGSAYNSKINSEILSLSKKFNIPYVSVKAPNGKYIPPLGKSFDKLSKNGNEDEEKVFGFKLDKDSILKKLMDFVNPQKFIDKINSVVQGLLDAARNGARGLLDFFNPRNGTTTNQFKDVLPEGNPQLTSRFGPRTVRWGSKDHKGIDIGVDRGSRVLSLEDGTVTVYDNATWNSFGQAVVVSHADGTSNIYGHVDPTVKTGDKVKKGQVIAKVKFWPKGAYGATNDDNTHLHLERRLGGVGFQGRAVDPAKYLNDRAGVTSPGSTSPGRVTGTPQQSALPKPQGLGRQTTMPTRDFGSTSSQGKKGYIIVPGHASGGGAPGEKEMVIKLAQNAYNNIKAKNPNANVTYMNLDSMFEDTDLGPSYPNSKRYPGFNKQKEWYKQKESEGYEVLEVHLDQKGGTGKGVIVPHKELNAVEAEFARSHGAYPRDWRSKPGEEPLAAPDRGVSMFELGNVPDKLDRNIMNYLTKPLEDSVLKASDPSRLKFQTMNQKGTSADKQFLIINQQSQPRITGQGSQTATQFVPMGPGRWRSEVELTEQIRSLYMNRLQ